MFDEENAEPELVTVTLYDPDGVPFYEEDGDTPVTMDITVEQYEMIHVIAQRKNITFNEALSDVLKTFLELEKREFGSDIHHHPDGVDEGDDS